LYQVHLAMDSQTLQHKVVSSTPCHRQSNFIA
jgi:hypothetical protein